MTLEFEKARQLEDRVDSLIDKARTLNDEDFGAVNWGDIAVVDIIEERSLLRPQDPPVVIVKIEEAAPECHLASWLSDQISDTGAYVVAEW